MRVYTWFLAQCLSKKSLMRGYSSNFAYRNSMAIWNRTPFQFLLQCSFGEFDGQKLLDLFGRKFHTKFLLVDALADDPLVCTGSANFSSGSLTENDETSETDAREHTEVPA